MPGVQVEGELASKAEELLAWCVSRRVFVLVSLFDPALTRSLCVLSPRLDACSGSCRSSSLASTPFSRAELCCPFHQVFRSLCPRTGNMPHICMRQTRSSRSKSFVPATLKKSARKGGSACTVKIYVHRKISNATQDAYLNILHVSMRGSPYDTLAEMTTSLTGWLSGDDRPRTIHARLSGAISSPASSPNMRLMPR